MEDLSLRYHPMSKAMEGLMGKERTCPNSCSHWSRGTFPPNCPTQTSSTSTDLKAWATWWWVALMCLLATLHPLKRFCSGGEVGMGTSTPSSYKALQTLCLKSCRLQVSGMGRKTAKGCWKSCKWSGLPVKIFKVGPEELSHHLDISPKSSTLVGT